MSEYKIKREKTYLSQNYSHVTINNYDSLVINSEKVWIADIDVNETLKEVFPDVLEQEFLEEIKSYEHSPRELALSKIRNKLELIGHLILENLEDGLFSLYETPKGLRLIRLDKLMSPQSGESDKLLSEVYSDELYRKLCIFQNCYRARLTPKPWRKNDSTDIGSARWIGDFQVSSGIIYDASNISDRFLHPQVKEVKEIHDQLSAVHSQFDLIG